MTILIESKKDIFQQLATHQKTRLWSKAMWLIWLISSGKSHTKQ